MTRERIGSLVLYAYPKATRQARGPEMLSMLLDAGATSGLDFTRECGSLLLGGVRERAHPHGLLILAAAAAMIVAILALGAIDLSNSTSDLPGDSSNMLHIAAEVAPTLRTGDVVLLAQPTLTPLASKYLPDGLRYITPLGLDAHPGVIQNDTTYGSLTPGSYQRWYISLLIAKLAPGHHLLFIRPVIGGPRSALTAHRSAVELRATVELGVLLASDRRLHVVAWAPRNCQPPSCTDAAIMYVKT